MEILDGPRVEERAERATLGIRERVPFRGMLAQRDRLLAELVTWLGEREIETAGPFFLRLRTVDMAGEMDIEVGVHASAAGNDRVTVGVTPAGDYAVLVYRNHSLQANRHLQAWVAERGRAFDVDGSPEGDRWRSRLESYLTDPRTEPRKTRWTTELAFLLR